MATQEEDKKLVFNTDYRLMQVKSIPSTFIKLPSVFKTFGLSIIEWKLKTGFTVYCFTAHVYILQIWNVHSVLNVLHSLVEKSSINRQLEVYTSGGQYAAVRHEKVQD